MPADLSQRLDKAFAELAPPGAAGTSVRDLFETLENWRFTPDIPIEGDRAHFSRLVRLVKRLLRPIATWQMRHLTDQLNAYAAVQTEILRKLHQGERDL